MEKNEKTLICMVSYFRKVLTEKSVGTFLKNTDSPFDLHIIDNNSTDGTKEYLQDLEKNNENVTVTLLDKNICKAEAANIIMPQCKEYKHFVYTDNDIGVPEKWLSSLIYAAENTKTWGLLALNNHVHFPHNKVEPKGAKLQNGQSVMFPGCVAGGIWMINPGLYDKIGGYTVKRFWGGIDGDYHNRSRKAGFRDGVIKELSFDHLGAPEFKSYNLYKYHVHHMITKGGSPEFDAKKGFFDKEE